MSKANRVTKWRIAAAVICVALYLSFGAFVLFTDATLSGPWAKLLVASFAGGAIFLLLATRKLGRQYSAEKLILLAILFLATALGVDWANLSRKLSSGLLLAAVVAYTFSLIVRRGSKQPPYRN
jgi:hypothetical protein